MTLIEFLHNQIKAMRDEKRMTNEEIAKICGLSRQHVNYILNGPSERVASLKFASILNIFPEITDTLAKHYRLEGNAVAIDHSAASVNGHVTVNNSPLDPRILDAIDLVLDEPEMCETCKAAAIRCIRKATRNKPE